MGIWTRGPTSRAAPLVLDDEEIGTYAPWLNPTCEPYGQDAQIGPVAFEFAEALHEQDLKIIARVTDLSGHEAVTRHTMR